MKQNELIYLQVCKLYFLAEANIEFIVELFGDILKSYKHLTHDGYIKFETPCEAVKAIIECEKSAHKQANPVQDKGKRISRSQMGILDKFRNIEEGLIIQE